MHENKIKIFLAPLQGRVERAMVMALGKVGGFDAAFSGFLSVPFTANIPMIVESYDPKEVYPYEYIPQILGRDPDLLSQVAMGLEAKGAKQIDFNAACPSQYVTAKKRGAYLLKEPDTIYAILKKLKESVSIPVSVKIRAGFDNTDNFGEIISAIDAAKPHFVTLHPRTKKDGYRNNADWSLIRRAKELLTSVPVIGNGDISTKEDAKQMLLETCCDGLMIGRGALINPGIFYEIKSFLFGEKERGFSSADLWDYIMAFQVAIKQISRTNDKISPLKGLFSCLYKKNANEQSKEELRTILRYQGKDPDMFIEKFFPLLEKYWK